MNTLLTFASLALPSLTLAETRSVYPAIPYRPFIDPLNFHELWWVMLLPMALGISVVYKAVRLQDLTGYVRAVLVMTGQIILGMALLAIGSYLAILVFATFVAQHRPG